MYKRESNEQNKIISNRAEWNKKQENNIKQNK